MKTQRRFVLVVPAGSIALIGYAVLAASTCLRNLDAGLGLFTFLVSALSIFLHCKHFNDLGLPTRTRRKGRQKNRSRNLHLVSRKALQNYCRSANRQNFYDIISRK
jgi:hypothetical protein